MGSRASYSWMRTKVGLLTTRLSAIPSPSATARTSWVLPAPSGPTRATTAPGKSRPARRSPKALVASRLGISMVNGSIDGFLIVERVHGGRQMSFVLVTGATGEVAHGVLPYLENQFELRLLAANATGD